ncbi:FtsX-like permease family protein [Entomohabitans teleogrylli]|uniref:FtsX-like permease family protein n=1 Tax=Entomohabitans teleogrylli TaxID=1384589 RepID=UPI00073D80E7|nr:FtsX-like permease family protein [Entomohabitans teleogrylli]
MIPWRLIWVNWRQQWPGMLVILLLIALATALSISISLQERALRMGSAQAADRFDLVIGAPGSETQLVLSSVYLQPSALTLVPATILDDLAYNPLVAWAAPVAFGDFYRDMPVVGTSAALVTDGGRRQLTQGRVFERGFEAVVGAGTGLRPGDTFSPVHGQAGSEGAHAHDEVHYTVVGVLPGDGSAWDKAILVPVASVWQVHGISAPHGEEEGHAHQHDADERHAGVHSDENDDPQADADGHSHQEAGVPAIVVKPKTVAGAYQLRSQYRTNDTLAVFPGEVLVKLYAILGDIRELLMYVSLGTQALVGVAVAMVAVIHLKQRQKQIGALRAFGAPRYGIFALIWCGLMVLVSSGVLLGVGLGYIAARGIALLMSSRSGFILPVTLEQEDAAFIVALLLVAAVVLTLPALLAYRQSPAVALRGE